MKDVVTSYWFNYKMATMEFGDRSEREAEEHALKSKFAIVTIHDVSPVYSNRIFSLADELEYISSMSRRHNFCEFQ